MGELRVCPVGAGNCANCDTRTQLHINNDTGKCSGLHVCSPECVESMKDMIAVAIERWAREASEVIVAVVEEAVLVP